MIIRSQMLLGAVFSISWCINTELRVYEKVKRHSKCWILDSSYADDVFLLHVGQIGIHFAWSETLTAIRCPHKLAFRELRLWSQIKESHISLGSGSLWGARGSVIGWSTIVLAGRSRGSIPNEVTGFFNSPNPSSSTMALGSTQPLAEMSTRNLPRGKRRPGR
jgi:hypothetical protein